MNIIGIDVGGANLKAVFLPADPTAAPWQAIETPFPMWQQWRTLNAAIEDLVRAVDPQRRANQIAVTMTGELADCFASKSEGVQHIAAAVTQAARTRGNDVAFYMTNGCWLRTQRSETGVPDGFFSGGVIGQRWPQLAASNWHAMASFGARFLNRQTGLMIDVGSTTTDLIPIIDGQPCPVGFDDYHRLLNQELIYAGVARTPITGLIQSVDLPDRSLPLAREFFATMDDALLWTGRVSDGQISIPSNDASKTGLAPPGNDSRDHRTADGRPRTKIHAGQRLSRMGCVDLATAGESIADAIAAAAVGRLEELMTGGIHQQLNRLQNLAVRQTAFDAGSKTQSEFETIDALIVGEGSDFVRRVLDRSFPELGSVMLADCLDQRCSDCGPAYAVAALLREVTS